MATLVGDKSNVIFSNINQSQLLTNTKIAAGPYEVDDNGNIINNIPVINAIDIDWNNVIANDIQDPIKSTSDLIHIISSNKVNIRLTNEELGNLKTEFNNIKNKINGIEDIDFETIQSDLTNAFNDIATLQSNNESINNSLISISQTIDTINNSINSIRIPHRVSDLEDGSNVLTRDNFESIKDELQGESAYDIAKKLAQQNGQSFPYDESEWLASLKGEKGNSGTSAYEIAKQTAITSGKEFPYNNESEWIESLGNLNESKSYTDEKVNEVKLYAGDGIVIENNRINASVSTWINL